MCYLYILSCINWQYSWMVFGMMTAHEWKAPHREDAEVETVVVSTKPLDNKWWSMPNWWLATKMGHQFINHKTFNFADTRRSLKSLHLWIMFGVTSSNLSWEGKKRKKKTINRHMWCPRRRVVHTGDIRPPSAGHIATSQKSCPEGKVLTRVQYQQTQLRKWRHTLKWDMG